MSTSKLDTSGVFQPAKVQSPRTRLSLAANSVHFHKNGMEFRTEKPFPAWTEMSVDVVSPADSKKVRCTGVVVACNGNRHAGYNVSMVFVNMTRQSQERLDQLAFARLFTV